MSLGWHDSCFILHLMPRLPRIVIPGLPHHITQRGNRRQKTFFEEVDYKTYLKSMSLACKRFDVKIWAYCLMSNHVHFRIKFCNLIGSRSCYV
ncbi:MAG: transposase [Bdellovibrionota bacterium]